MSSTHQTSDTKKRLNELDALRGIATFFVVFHHYTMNRPQSNNFWQTGFLAVDLFFVVSGFVITMTLEKCRTSKEFLLKRAIRIYPTFWLCMTITTLVLLKFGFEHWNTQTLIKYLSNLTLFHFYLGQQSMDGVYWTLVVELWFYLLMALVFKLTKADKLDTPIAVTLLLLTLFGIYTIVSPLSPRYHGLVYGLAPILFLFPNLLAGICFYLIMFKKATNFRYFLLVGCFICSGSMLTLDLRIHVVGPYTYYGKLLVIYGLFLLLIRGNLKFIVNPVTLFLGRISYPLYLIHMNIGLLIVIPLFMRFVPFWFAAVLTFFLMIITAFSIYQLLEGPSKKIIRKKYYTV